MTVAVVPNENDVILGADKCNSRIGCEYATPAGISLCLVKRLTVVMFAAPCGVIVNIACLYPNVDNVPSRAGAL